MVCSSQDVNFGDALLHWPGSSLPAAALGGLALYAGGVASLQATRCHRKGTARQGVQIQQGFQAIEVLIYGANPATFSPIDLS